MSAVKDAFAFTCHACARVPHPDSQRHRGGEAPRDQGRAIIATSAAVKDRRTGEPEDRRTGEPENRRTGGPEDRRVTTRYICLFLLSFLSFLSLSFMAERLRRVENQGRSGSLCLFPPHARVCVCARARVCQRWLG